MLLWFNNDSHNDNLDLCRRLVYKPIDPLSLIRRNKDRGMSFPVKAGKVRAVDGVVVGDVVEEVVAVDEGGDFI